MYYQTFAYKNFVTSFYFPFLQAGKELSEKKSQEFEQLLSTIESYIRYQVNLK